MPPFLPPVDEHGFPIPPTFDGPAAPRRSSQFLGRTWQLGLVLAFIGLLIGWLYQSDVADGLKGYLAELLVGRAKQKVTLGDFPGALADLERAASWSPEDPAIYELRAALKLETNDVVGSLKDYDQLVRLSPRYAQAYLARSVVYQRLDRHREAIDDLTKAISLSPSRDATPRNNRAYARALAGIELDAALADVEQALNIVDNEVNDPELSLHDPQKVRLFVALRNGQKAAYLDTRGYIYFLQKKYDLALEDLDKAIEFSLAWRAIYLPLVQDAQRARAQQRLDRELSVMYHHRGQVLEKLGRADEAKSDLDRGDRMGYNPSEGVF